MRPFLSPSLTPSLPRVGSREPSNPQRVLAAMTDGWYSCFDLEGIVGLSRVATDSALQQQRRRGRVEAEHPSVGGRYTGVTQRYRRVAAAAAARRIHNAG